MVELLPQDLAFQLHDDARCGPKSLIQHRVVLEAQRLLVHTALPVEGISVELGFYEPANFTRMFRRIAGVSPGSFRDDRRRALDVQ